MLKSYEQIQKHHQDISVSEMGDLARVMTQEVVREVPRVMVQDGNFCATHEGGIYPR